LKFRIYRYDPERDAKPRLQEYDVALDPTDRMLLDALMRLKAVDDTLSFRRSCREGVCGSDAMNINGKNRLGTNSLLDLLVFGRAAGNFIVGRNVPALRHKPLPGGAGDASLARLARLDSAASGESVADVGNDLRKTMQAHCGVFRNQALLAEGVQKVMELERRVQQTAISDKSRVFNTARVEALELDNLIETAKATIVSAEARRESRGAQARSDFPSRDDANWLKHTLWYRDGNRLDYKPVNLKPLSVEAFPPKARTY
jgi:succinate dehydrogenase / fumarate reductase flavoprotein subunit